MVVQVERAADGVGLSFVDLSELAEIYMRKGQEALEVALRWPV